VKAVLCTAVVKYSMLFGEGCIVYCCRKVQHVIWRGVRGGLCTAVVKYSMLFGEGCIVYCCCKAQHVIW
jgi:hypothetical protein